MANYQSSMAVHATLVANTADTVQLARETPSVTVFNRGTPDIFVSVGTNAVGVGQNDTLVVPANSNVVVNVDSTYTVNLISAGTPPYSVVAQQAILQ